MFNISSAMAFSVILCYHGNMKFLNNMKKNACLFGYVFIVCISILSCVSTGMNAEPEYLIKAKRDNGFISAYKAHFALDGESLYKISERKYEALTLGEDSKYKMIVPDTLSFDISAPGNDKSKWEIVLPSNYMMQEGNITEPYLRESLIADLTQMGITYTGSLYVLVTRFDDYKIVQVTNLDGNTVIDETYALFKNGSQLPLSKDIDLSSIWRIYRLK